MIKVFLCHASLDKPRVRKLYTYLRKQGVDAWLDTENLIAGQDWKVEIPNALANSDAIIICLSKNSIGKEGYIQKEIRFALDKALEIPKGRIFLIPARLEECIIPDELSNYQWVNLFEKNGVAKLMRSIKIREEQVQGKHRAGIDINHISDINVIVNAENETDDFQAASNDDGMENSAGVENETVPSIEANYVTVDNFDFSRLPYIIDREIGRGEHSIVYQSTHKMLGTSVAIKIFKSSVVSDQAMRNEVIKNIKIISALKFVSFITIYSLETDDNLLAIAMEYIPSGNLRQWQMEKARSLEEILLILEQTADALDFLHSQRYQSDKPLLHLNVKPENILVDFDASNKKNRILLTDFGIPTGVSDSPIYFSPEQTENVAGEYLTERADQYSLGVIAYELFTGKHPFDGNKTALATMKRLDNDHLPMPSMGNSKLPVELDQPILRALSRYPEGRYASCRDFIRSLDNAIQASYLRMTRELIEEARKDIEIKDFVAAHSALEKATSVTPGDQRIEDLRTILKEKSELSDKYSEGLREWQNARQQAAVVLDLWPRFLDAQNLFPRLGLRPFKESISPLSWGIQIVVGVILSIPLILLLIYLMFRWIVRG